MVTIENLSVEYNPFFRPKKPVLKDLDLKIDTGTIYSVVGANGSGKTTLLRSVLGLIKPVEGQIEVLGKIPWQERKSLMQHVGVILNGKRGFSSRWTVTDVLDFMTAVYKRPATTPEDIIQRFNLQDFRLEFVERLSTGTAQRLALSLAFLHEPQLIILDEPTLGLDTDSKELLRKEMLRHKESKGSILITSHDRSFIDQSFDKIYRLSNGQLESIQTSTERAVQTITLRLASGYGSLPDYTIEKDDFVFVEFDNFQKFLVFCTEQKISILYFESSHELLEKPVL